MLMYSSIRVTQVTVYHAHACVCVRVCVRVCARTFVRFCVYVCARPH